MHELHLITGDELPEGLLDQGEQTELTWQEMLLFGIS